MLLTQHQQSPDDRILLRDFLALALHGNHYCARASRAQIARLQVLCRLVSGGTHGQGITMTENESKVQKYLCMLFHPSIHSFFVNKFDVSYLTLTIVRRREIHMRYLNKAAVGASAEVGRKHAPHSLLLRKTRAVPARLWCLVGDAQITSRGDFAYG